MKSEEESRLIKKLRNRKPLINNASSPKEIVYLDRETVAIHFNAVKNTSTTEEHDKAVSRLKLTRDELRRISEIYQELRENGFFIHEIITGKDGYENSKFVFGQAKKSDLQLMVESYQLIDRYNFDFRKSLDRLFEIPRDTSMDPWPEKEQAEQRA